MQDDYLLGVKGHGTSYDGVFHDLHAVKEEIILPEFWPFRGPNNCSDSLYLNLTSRSSFRIPVFKTGYEKIHSSLQSISLKRPAFQPDGVPARSAQALGSRSGL